MSLLVLVVWRCTGCGRIEFRVENDGEPAPCMAHHRSRISTTGAEVLDLRGAYRWVRIGFSRMELVHEGPEPRTLPAPAPRRRVAPTIEPLPDDARMILDFEREWAGRYRGKEAAIRWRFGMSSTIYQARLNDILDLPAAALYAPALVGRLKSLRARRRDMRRGRPLSVPPMPTPAVGGKEEA